MLPKTINISGLVLYISNRRPRLLRLEACKSVELDDWKDNELDLILHFSGEEIEKDYINLKSKLYIIYQIWITIGKKYKLEKGRKVCR